MTQQSTSETFRISAKSDRTTRPMTGARSVAMAVETAFINSIHCSSVGKPTLAESPEERQTVIGRAVSNTLSIEGSQKPWSDLANPAHARLGCARACPRCRRFGEGDRPGSRLPLGERFMRVAHNLEPPANA